MGVGVDVKTGVNVADAVGVVVPVGVGEAVAVDVGVECSMVMTAPFTGTPVMLMGP